MSDEVSRLLKWIAENVEAEPMSGLFPGGPIWNVSAPGLLLAVGNIWGLSPAEVGAVFNPVRERVEAAP